MPQDVSPQTIWPGWLARAIFVFPYLFSPQRHRDTEKFNPSREACPSEPAGHLGNVLLQFLCVIVGLVRIGRLSAVATTFGFTVSLLLAGLSHAQEPGSESSFPLRISPTFSTMLVNETRSFSLSGEDGRPLRGAQWSITGDSVAISATDPPTARALRPGRAALTAVLGTRSAMAWVTVVAGNKLPVSTTRWSNPPLPGSSPAAMSAAHGSPDANQPDLVTDEITPTGIVTRAFSSDGRELWRHKIAPSLVPPDLPSGEAPTVKVPPREPIMALGGDGSIVYAANLDRGPVGVITVGPGGKIISHYRYGGTPPSPDASSGAQNNVPRFAIKECRSLVPGMTKENVLELFGPKMSLTSDQFEQGTWRVPASPEMDCVIVFDAQGRVLSRHFAASDNQ